MRCQCRRHVKSHRLNSSTPPSKKQQVLYMGHRHSASRLCIWLEAVASEV